MASKRDQTPIDVTWEDQRGLCTFGRMNRRFQELDVEIRRRVNDVEKLTDAADEIIIADDVKYVFGEAFVTLNCDDVAALIDSKKSVIEGELSALQSEKQELEKSMNALKSVLYAKFGSQVYLEPE